MPYPPSSFDADHQDDVDFILAADINTIEEAINEIVSELGASPSGSENSVQARLTALEAAIAALDPPASTDDIDEGITNKYYTDARVNTRFDSKFGSKTTDDLAEGAVNLYFTDARVDFRVGNALGIDSLNGVPQHPSEEGWLLQTTDTAWEYILASTLGGEGGPGGPNADTLGGELPAYYLDRGNHSGSQLAATISDLAATITAAIAATNLAALNDVPAHPGAADRILKTSGASGHEYVTISSVLAAAVDSRIPAGDTDGQVPVWVDGDNEFETRALTMEDVIGVAHPGDEKIIKTTALGFEYVDVPTGGANDAVDVTFDDTTSGTGQTDVQGALDYVVPRVTTLENTTSAVASADGASIVLSSNAARAQRHNMTANATFSPAASFSGKFIVLVGHATNDYTVTWAHANFTWRTELPPATIRANEVYLVYISRVSGQNANAFWITNTAPEGSRVSPTAGAVALSFRARQNTYQINLNANTTTTITVDSERVVTSPMVVVVRQDSTGGRTHAFSGVNSWATSSGGDPGILTTAHSTTIYEFYQMQDSLGNQRIVGARVAPGDAAKQPGVHYTYTHNGTTWVDKQGNAYVHDSSRLWLVRWRWDSESAVTRPDEAGLFVTDDILAQYAEA